MAFTATLPWKGKKEDGTYEEIIDASGDIVSGAALPAGSISATELASDSVITAKILNANVTAAKLASDAVETAKIKDSNVTTAKILDANVTLGKLAAGITPSHVVKFFKLGSTITTTALAGLLVGDLCVYITAAGACTVTPCGTADTLPADPADTDYVVVFRAAA